MHYFKLFRLTLVPSLVTMMMLTGSLAVLPTEAQGGDSCEQLVADTLAVVQEVCNGLARGEVCFGHASMTAEGVNGDSVLIASPGDRTALVSLDRLLTTPSNLETAEWGVAAMMFPAGLPDSLAGVTAWIFGDAHIARPVLDESDRLTLTIRNAGSAAINLRSGAGSVGYDVIGQLAPGDEALADGRNSQGDWVRIQYNDLVAWVFTPLIDWEGDIQTLEELSPNDITPSSVAGEPFDAFTLITGSDAGVCSTAPSGLLLQYTGELPANLLINGVRLEFADATLFVSSLTNEALEVKALTGSANVIARGITEEVTSGQAVQVSLGGNDGMTPIAQPSALGRYAFAEIAYLPLGLLSEAMTCTVGVADGVSDVRLRVGPGDQRGELAVMNAALIYSVRGWANDPEGDPWWELDTGTQSSWVRQSQVRSIGACEKVAQVDAPPVVAPQAGAPAGGAAASGPDLAPTANSVWQMHPGSDQMSGQCSGAPAINFCDHLAAIAPIPGGISWKGMEATAYSMSRIQPNVYSYSGPNALGTGRVNMTLTFSSESQLNMTMVLTLNSEPNCQHTYFYTGTKNW